MSESSDIDVTEISDGEYDKTAVQKLLEYAVEDLSSEIIQKLKSLRIKLQHVVPKQHKIENRAGSRPPSIIQKQMFEKYGPLKKGLFTLKEDEIIKRNWELFCEVHNWDLTNVQPFLTMKHNGKMYMSLEQRQKFVKFLSNDLPWRSLYSVYNRFKLIYKPKTNVSYRYTPKEDKIILQFMNNKALYDKDYTCVELSKILKRDKFSIWHRYRILKQHAASEAQMENIESNICWTLPLTTKFIKVLISATLVDDVKQLKDALIPKVVWEKMEEVMKIKHNSLRLFWLNQLHMQLFCPRPIFLNDLKIKLIEYIYEKQLSHLKDIMWSKLARHFDGVTTYFLRQMLYIIMKDAVQKTGTTDFAHNIKYLYINKKLDLLEQEVNKYLPRLTYENGKLNFINDNIDPKIVS